MQVEDMMLLGWAALPLIAFTGGSLALSRTVRRRERRAPDAQQRLAQLRRLRDDGRVVPRGRMADAVMLAEDAGSTTSLRVR